MKALIALEDGTLFEGQSFTGPGEAVWVIVTVAVKEVALT